MIDVIEKRNQLIDQMDEILSRMHAHNVEAADAECQYKLLAGHESVRLRSEGLPASLIDKICGGMPEVAEARRKWLILKGLLIEDQEALNVCKIKIKSLEEEIKRAWVQT